MQHEPFGVFVDLGDGITGLVEIVSLPDADRRRLNITDFPPVGSRIRAVVLLTHGREPRLDMRQAGCGLNDRVQTTCEVANDVGAGTPPRAARKRLEMKA